MLQKCEHQLGLTGVFPDMSELCFKLYALEEGKNRLNKEKSRSGRKELELRAQQKEYYGIKSKDRRDDNVVENLNNISQGQRVFYKYTQYHADISVWA